VRRREIIVLVGAVVSGATGSFVVRAQQAAMPVIGFLNVASPELFATRVAAFFRGLNEFGYVEGRNLSVEYRWANGDYALLPALASDLARRQVNVIAATGGIPSAIAAKEATPTIPVVFVAGSQRPEP
jgi:putative tryptophan/tyrosine transport system substrate-binding protein